MENPTKEIEGVIKALTHGNPKKQEATLSRHFLQNASFSHPYCHVPSFSKGLIPFFKGLDSRWVLLAIYRWYRILSPHIDIKIDSVAFDQSREILYVTIRQTFAVWFIPFYKAPVRLVSVLQLTQQPATSAPEDSMVSNGSDRDKNLYYITSQEDLYPATDCFQFLLPKLGPLIWFMWQLFSTCLCVMGSLLFLPLYVFLNQGEEVDSVL
ncbi:hypothetical protein EDB80DRAFT_757484 [Ilyonectria destructans]|nr:hypothetical protein EDB80DRAFT_757484 [Ilyonectria destructans]